MTHHPRPQDDDRGGGVGIIDRHGRDDARGRHAAGRELPGKGQGEKLELLTASLDRPLTVAYGRHLVGGNLIFEHENADKTITRFIALGEGPWDGIEILYVNGLPVDLTDTTQFHFHPGNEGELGVEASASVENQKICSLLPSSFYPPLAFARTAYLALKLKPDPTAPSKEFQVLGILRTRRVRLFDGDGNQVNAKGTVIAAPAQSDLVYTANPAWIALDLLIRRFIKPKGKLGEALTSAEKARIDFLSFWRWAARADEEIAPGVKRWEAHVALVDETDLLRALEWVALLGRGFIFERAGKFAAFHEEDRLAYLTIRPENIVPGSLILTRQSVRTAPNRLFFRYRSLNSGDGPGVISSSGTAITGTGTDFLARFKKDMALQVRAGGLAGQSRRIASVTDDTHESLAKAFSSDLGSVPYGNPGADFQPQVKEYADEALIDQIGREIKQEWELGNQTGERIDRVSTYEKTRLLDLPLRMQVALLANFAGANDLMPGDVAYSPDALNFFTSRNWEILEITDNPDGTRELRAMEYSSSQFTDKLGIQQAAGPSLPPAPPLPATSTSYRPTSNPLTATDAGTTATINIGAFTMRIAGVDISLNAGSITALSFNTLYYIYYDDEFAKGGSPAAGYQATTTKEVALQGTGRFFVGSVRTPADAGAATNGNNDGGAGAQIAGRIFRKGTSESFSAAGTTTGAGNGIDGNWATLVSRDLSGNITLIQVWAVVSGFGIASEDAGRAYGTVILRVKALASVTNEGDVPTANSTAKIQYSTDSGANWTDIASQVAPDAQVSTLGDIPVALAAGTDPSKVQVRAFTTGHGGGASNNGILSAQIYEAELELA